MQPLLKTSEDSAQPAAAKCSVAVLDAVPAVIWFIRRRMRAQRKGLSIPQFRALCLIRWQPAANISAVAEHLGASLPTASRLIGGLETKGLLRRRGCKDDRRQVELIITRQGAAVMDGARGATLAEMEAEMMGLNERQRDLITRAMGLLHGVFDPAVPSAAAAAVRPTATARGGTRLTTPKL